MVLLEFLTIPFCTNGILSVLLLELFWQFHHVQMVLLELLQQSSPFCANGPLSVLLLELFWQFHSVQMDFCRFCCWNYFDNSILYKWTFVGSVAGIILIDNSILYKWTFVGSVAGIILTIPFCTNGLLSVLLLELFWQFHSVQMDFCRFCCWNYFINSILYKWTFVGSVAGIILTIPFCTNGLLSVLLLELFYQFHSVQMDFCRFCYWNYFINSILYKWTFVGSVAGIILSIPFCTNGLLSVLLLELFYQFHSVQMDFCRFCCWNYFINSILYKWTFVGSVAGIILSIPFCTNGLLSVLLLELFYQFHSVQMDFCRFCCWNYFINSILYKWTFVGSVAGIILSIPFCTNGLLSVLLLELFYQFHSVQMDFCRFCCWNYFINSILYKWTFVGSVAGIILSIPFCTNGLLSVLLLELFYQFHSVQMDFCRFCCWNYFINSILYKWTFVGSVAGIILSIPFCTNGLLSVLLLELFYQFHSVQMNFCRFCCWNYFINSILYKWTFVGSVA